MDTVEFIGNEFIESRGNVINYLGDDRRTYFPCRTFDKEGKLVKEELRPPNFMEYDNFVTTQINQSQRVFKCCDCGKTAYRLRMITTRCRPCQKLRQIALWKASKLKRKQLEASKK